MNTKSTAANRQLVNQINYETILTDWVETTADFYLGYHQLVAYLHQKMSQEKLRAKKITYIGQCPMVSVTRLFRTMQVELERLLQDMELFDTLQQVTTAKKYQKMRTHTRILKRLNQQAQTRLLLMTRSTQ